MRVLSGLLRPQSGTVAFAGEMIHRLPAPRIVEAGLVQIPEGRRLWPRMTVLENLELGAYVPALRARRQETLDWVLSLFPRLGERPTQLAGTLSGGEQQMLAIGDRKSTRLNSSHSQISYAVFCLKKKKKIINMYL